MAERLFVIGASGKIGRELISQIETRGDMDPRIHRNPTRIVGVASSTLYEYNPNGLEEGRSIKRHGGISDLLNIITDDRGTLRVIDVTAAEEMLTLHKAVIRSTRHTIVTANKLPLVNSTFEEFTEMTSNPQRYGYRCSVMAGADVVPFLRDLKDLGEQPSEISGCFSGTLGYITSGLESGKQFSSVLREAVHEGYTEPNPAVDLSGNDVAAKLLILARTAGFNVGRQDVEPTPLISSKYLSETDVSVLLSKVEEADEPIARSISQAQAKGETLRYVASLSYDGGKPSLAVEPKYLPIEHPLGQLRGTANKVMILTGPYQEVPNVYEAPGAGVNLTARNIRRDLLSQIRDRETC